MENRQFGKIGQVSALTLGGGGLAGAYGDTSRDEAVATIREAVDSGITFIDVAPAYGKGKAERVVGEAFGGKLPDGVGVSTKYGVGNPPPEDVAPNIERSLNESLERLKLDRIDLFFLHGFTILDESAAYFKGTPRSLFVDYVRPTFEKLLQQGRIGAWGITGIGVPDIVIESINDDPAPYAVQALTNLLDSPGAMIQLGLVIPGTGRTFDAPAARPRDIIAAAARRGVGVMGIRAVQAGALTDRFDREVPENHLDYLDFKRAEPFRALAKDLGESPASLAHRYALSMSSVSTVILGVKNRVELRECVQAEARGPLDTALIERIDAAVGLG